MGFIKFIFSIIFIGILIPISFFLNIFIIGSISEKFGYSYNWSSSNGWEQQFWWQNILFILLFIGELVILVKAIIGSISTKKQLDVNKSKYYLDDEFTISTDNPGIKCIDNPTIERESKFYYSKPKVIIDILWVVILPIIIGITGIITEIIGSHLTKGILLGSGFILFGIIFGIDAIKQLYDTKAQLIINEKGISLTPKNKQFLWKDVFEEHFYHYRYRNFIRFYHVPSKSVQKIEVTNLNITKESIDGILRTHRARSDSPFYHQDVSKQK